MSDIRAICNLSDSDFEARRTQLREGLFLQIRGREELPDGVALLFDATPKLREELGDFVAFESECCPGLGLSVHEDSGALRLEVRGLDLGASDVAGFAERGESGKLEASGWRRLLRSAGLGAVGSFVLFCGVPIGAVAVLGTQLPAPFGALDNPWAIGAGTLVFVVWFWRWEQRRARARVKRASAGSCGC